MIHEMGELPPSEMSKIEAFDALPENMTYPFVTPVLFEEAKRTL